MVPWFPSAYLQMQRSLDLQTLTKQPKSFVTEIPIFDNLISCGDKLAGCSILHDTLSWPNSIELFCLFFCNVLFHSDFHMTEIHNGVLHLESYLFPQAADLLRLCFWLDLLLPGQTFLLPSFSCVRNGQQGTANSHLKQKQRSQQSWRQNTKQRNYCQKNVMFYSTFVAESVWAGTHLLQGEKGPAWVTSSLWSVCLCSE